MKRNVLFVIVAVAVLSVFFPIVWLIVQVLARDFPALGFAAGAVSFALSLGLTGYVLHDMAAHTALAETNSSAVGSSNRRIESTSDLEFETGTHGIASTSVSMGKAI